MKELLRKLMNFKTLSSQVEECKQKIQELKEVIDNQNAEVEYSNSLFSLTMEQFNSIYNAIKGSQISIDASTTLTLDMNDPQEALLVKTLGHCKLPLFNGLYLNNVSVSSADVIRLITNLKFMNPSINLLWFNSSS